MPTLKISFPAGRYHATPSGHHVNEGQIEWPPSPWRMLRALVASGYNTQQWMEMPKVARSLFEKLSTCLPSYRLPCASASHSRHYMPVGSFEKGREKTTLVYDAWANVPNEDLIVHWKCDLVEEESTLLRQLANCLSYLGRSESWVDAELIDDSEIRSLQFNSFPHASGRPVGQNWEQMILMSAMKPDEYQSWRIAATEKSLLDFPLPEGKRKASAKLLKDRNRILAPYPVDILDCLQKDTAWWKHYRWSQPPGSERVVYWRPSDSLEVGVPHRILRPKAKSVTTILLAITTATGNKSALPTIQRTLPQAELIHRAVVGRVAKGGRVACPELTGKDSEGNPLTGRHEHAHVLPVDLDGDGHLDHIIIHAAMGLSDAAQTAIRTLRRTWTKGGVGELQIAMAGNGNLDALRSLPVPFSFQVDRVLGTPQGNTTWTSITPFVPPRFLKARGRNSLAGQVTSELESRGLPVPVLVEQMDWNDKTLPLRHFVRVRRGRKQPPNDIGFALRLEFAEPMRIAHPFSIGYASHFGLGLFGASPENV
ncbi:MAG: type I-U CRISPR-associated protein Csb2 [Planctomycetota bacterium]